MNATTSFSRSVAFRWLVVMTASLLFFYNFMELNILNAIDSALMKDFSIKASELGSLSSMYFYANCLFLFPAGLILDRFSTRKLILTSMLVSVLSMFGFALSPNIMAAGISRFCMGLAGSFCFLSCIRLASRWFPPKQMALVSGCVVTMAMLGGMVAQTPVQLLSSVWGWRNAMLVAGFLGVIFLFIMWAIVRDWPEGSDNNEKNLQNASSIGFWKSIYMVLGNRYNWLGGFYTALMNLPIFLLGALWGNIYLEQASHLTATQASSVSMMIFIGTIIGAPLVGWISDSLTRRILPMVVGAVISLAIVLVIIYQPNLSFITLLSLFLLLGLATSTQVLSYPTVAELNSPLLTGSAVSIVSIMIMASGFIFQPFFGWLMDLHWSHKIVNGIAIYSVQDFHFSMLIMPVSFVLSIIVALLMKETYCKAYNS